LISQVGFIVLAYFQYSTRNDDLGLGVSDSVFSLMRFLRD
jgi:hypothetical protein